MVQVVTRVVNVLDPTGDVYREPHARAPRPQSIRGMVVGLLDNHRPDSKLFMDALAEVLVRDYGVRALRRSKPNLSLPCPQDTFQELVRDADFLVAGVGV